MKELYTEAIDHPDIIGLVIGTRPDCINEDIIDFLSDLAKDYFIALEFGVESTINRTLDLINRCHTFEETIAAYEMANNRGLHLGAHMIIGLPGETKDEILEHASRLSELPIKTLKLHHLQVVKHTMMAIQLKNTPEMFNLFSVEEYVDLITDFVARVRPDIIIERFISESPKHLLIAPQWDGMKNFEVVAKIDKKLEEKDLWQGKYCQVGVVE